MSLDQKHAETPEHGHAELQAIGKTSTSFFSLKSAQLWVVLFLISTLVLHACGIVFFRTTPEKNAQAISPELSVGD
jgi:hypothetical protein